MSVLIRESFDPYAIVSDLDLFWDYTNFNTGSTRLVSGASTRFGVGQALQVDAGNNSVFMGKNFGSNQQTIFIAFAQFTAALNSNSNEDCYFRFYDGSTVQCSVVFCTNGDLKVYRSDLTNNGTKVLLQTWSGTFSGSVWTHWQIKVVISGTVGEVHIRKNGNPVDDYAVTNLNLQMSANSYANKFDYGTNANSQGIQRTMDDFVCYSGSGAAPWNDFVGDIRCQQVTPAADTAQRDFAPSPSVPVFGNNAPSAGNGGMGSNQIEFYAIVADATGTVDANGQLYLYSGPGTGNHITLGLYDSTGAGGAPGNLIAWVNLTSPIAGQNLFTFNTSFNVVRNQVYYYALVTNSSFEVNRPASATALNRYKQTYTYNGTLPATAAPLGDTTAYPACVFANFTSVLNSSMVADLVMDYDATTVLGSNVGDYDLYQNEGMSSTPSAILGLSVRMFAAKTDTQFREATVHFKSGSTELDGQTVNLSSDYLLFDFELDTDPNTGAAWTAAGVNNLTYGPKVVA